MALGIDFSWIFIDFGRQVGAKLALKIDQKSIQKDIKKMMGTKRRSKTSGARLRRVLDRLEPGAQPVLVRFAALLRPGGNLKEGEPSLKSTYKNFTKNSTKELSPHADTQLGARGPGADIQRAAELRTRHRACC